MFKRIDHVEIVPSDIERSLEFYTSILGFKFKERFPVANPPMKEVAFVRLGDTMLELISVQDPAPPTKPWEVGYRSMAIEVDDMDAAVEDLKKKGIAITWGPVTLGKSKRAEIQDPDGLTIELRQW